MMEKEDLEKGNGLIDRFLIILVDVNQKEEVETVIEEEEVYNNCSSFVVFTLLFHM